ncbi:MAG: hypothetical protein NTZ72_06325 [Afipia sp.]|nr:hypothetical protein [Afipia sp.]
MSEADLKKLTVDAFPLSGRRAALWNNVTAFVAHLKRHKLACDIWIDGSFLTQKIDPDDVDFVLDFAIQTIETATPAQEDFLHQVGSHAFYANEKLHSFIMFHAPIIHGQHAEGVRLHGQWMSDFGISLVKKTPKGIALLEVR